MVFRGQNQKHHLKNDSFWNLLGLGSRYNMEKGWEGVEIVDAGRFRREYMVFPNIWKGANLIFLEFVSKLIHFVQEPL